MKGFITESKWNGEQMEYTLVVYRKDFDDTNIVGHEVVVQKPGEQVEIDVKASVYD